MTSTRVVATILALVALQGCAPALRPIPAVPAPSAAAAPSPAPFAPDSQAPTTVEEAAGVAIPDSLTTQYRLAITQVGASLGLAIDQLMGPALPAAEGSAVADEGEPTWDIDVTSYATHEQVTRYVNLFAGPARERIQAKLQRGKAYEAMIRAKFRAGGIPEDMYYLALVESGYDPHAYSRAAAVGMWQFMSSTARGVGLRVDHWVDERRDPVRATDAAARFLNLLHQQFGSYYLAAAAYNGGPGRVSRGLARFQDELQEVAGDDRFFALAEQSYLRSETRNYVPQLIAAALIGKAPARYGMAVSDSVAPFAYDSVEVPPLTSVGLAARLLDRPVAEVRDLNPHLLRGVTPPAGNRQLRLPLGTATAFEAAWAATPEAERTAFDTVRSKKGQTLAAIARAHGADARRVAWFNPGVSATRRLPAGTRVLVPEAHVIAAARDVPNPSIERYGSAPAAGGRVVHVVRRGESLGLIARRYRTSVAALQRANGLKRTVVYAGQSIIVRSGRASARRPSTAARTVTRKATSSKARSASKGKAGSRVTSKKPASGRSATAARRGR